MAIKQTKKASNTFVFTASYYTDLFDENTLHAVLIRSPISSGTIRSISLANIPDGYKLFTADDLPNQNPITVFETSFPVFAKEKISYKGEPIGILTGPKLAVLTDLLQKVSITYTEAFMKENENNSIDPKMIVASRQVSYSQTKKTKGENLHLIESHANISLDILETTETDGALCYASSKKLTVYTPTHWPKNLRENLQAVTEYDAENIIIHKTKLPLTEKNAPWKNTALAIQCAIASMLTKSSVLLSLSQSEQSLYNNYYSNIDIYHTSQISQNADILSCNVKIIIDVGAYNPFSKFIVDRLTLASMGPYVSEKLTIEVIAVTSNNPPTSLIIRSLDYHSFYAIETHIREIAKVTDLMPHEISIKNLYKENKKYPFQLDSSSYINILTNVLQKSDFNRKYAIYKLNPFTKKAKKNYFPVRGIGLSTAYEANGFFGTITDTSLHSLEVTIDINSKVIIKVLNASDTIATIWKEIASEILSVSTEDVVIDSLFYQNEEASLPETMLNNMHITAHLLKKACLAVQKQRFHQPLPISVKRTLSPASKKVWKDDVFTGKPYFATSWIALVVEIELNLPTFSYDVRNIFISIEAGNVMNKRKARYSIQNCVKKILSQVMKNRAYSEPVISISFLESSEEPKQIRELVYNALPAALSNALSQTLQTAIHTYPIGQEKLFHFFQEILDLKDTLDLEVNSEEENGN